MILLTVDIETFYRNRLRKYLFQRVVTTILLAIGFAIFSFGLVYGTEWVEENPEWQFAVVITMAVCFPLALLALLLGGFNLCRLIYRRIYTGKEFPR